MASSRTIEHYWAQDPELPSAVKGSAVVGGQQYLYIADPQAQALLTEILGELKKMNLYLSMLTEEELTENDIEGLVL